MRRRRGGAEDAEGRGRVPALVVVVEVDGAGEADLGLDADHVGGEEVAAARAGAPRRGRTASATSGTDWWPPRTPLKSS